MSDLLTPVERKVYHYLLDFLAQNTYQPSVREIGREFRIRSTKTVAEILKALQRKGYIERHPSRSRGVRLLGYEGARRAMSVPPYDNGAAPDPGGAHLTLDRRFLPNECVFYVKVAGDDASRHSILDGDYVLVDPETAAAAGDLVIEREGAAVTVRRSDAGDAAAATRLGKVCGVFRPFGESGEPRAPEDERALEVLQPAMGG